MQAQEGEALLCLTAESSTQFGEMAEPSETSRDTARSSDPRLARPCQPAHTRTKHHSGSNVSFSHDTEGGEDDQTQVKLCCFFLIWENKSELQTVDNCYTNKSSLFLPQIY